VDQDKNTAVLTFEDARHCVEEHAANLRPHGRELLNLLGAANRVLAEPVSADRDFPPFNRATRDGYAIKASDLAPLPAALQIIGEIQAGASADQAALTLRSGQAASIMTGAPVPSGADAVVMIEHTSCDGNSLTVRTAIEEGANIVAMGAEARRGECLLSPGVKLTPAALAIAASVGKAHLVVYSRPTVAVLATGNELVDLDIPPGPTQIRNSNGYSLAAQVLAAGGEPVLLPISPDEPKRLRELVVEGLEADLLLLSGGVSAGKYDFVEPVLAELGAEFLFTGVAIQPGRPLVFGRIAESIGTHAGQRPAQQHKYFFGIPGNPVSTMVTFELFVRPVIEALAGAQPQKLRFLRAKLKSDIKTKTGLKRFLPALLSGEFGNAEVELTTWHGSGDIAALSRSNCYVVIPPDRERLSAGEWVPVMMR
jgi:molybdopterin molybdotransferase